MTDQLGLPIPGFFRRFRSRMRLRTYFTDLMWRYLMDNLWLGHWFLADNVLELSLPDRLGAPVGFTRFNIHGTKIWPHLWSWLHNYTRLRVRDYLWARLYGRLEDRTQFSTKERWRKLLLEEGEP